MHGEEDALAVLHDVHDAAGVPLALGQLPRRLAVLVARRRVRLEDQQRLHHRHARGLDRDVQRRVALGAPEHGREGHPMTSQFH